MFSTTQIIRHASHCATAFGVGVVSCFAGSQTALAAPLHDSMQVTSITIQNVPASGSKRDQATASFVLMPKKDAKGSLPLRLNVPKIDDVVQTMKLPLGATVEHSSTTIGGALKNLDIDVADKALDFAKLLMSLRGQQVILQAREVIDSGTSTSIVVVFPKTPTVESYSGRVLRADATTVTLLSPDNVVKQFLLTQIAGVGLVEGVGDDFQKGLEGLSLLNEAPQTVTIQFLNNQSGGIFFSQPLPFWKPQYRLEITDPTMPMTATFSAWAVVDNTCPFDWPESAVLRLSSNGYQFQAQHNGIPSGKQMLVPIVPIEADKPSSPASTDSCDPPLKPVASMQVSIDLRTLLINPSDVAPANKYNVDSSAPADPAKSSVKPTDSTKAADVATVLALRITNDKSPSLALAGGSIAVYCKNKLLGQGTINDLPAGASKSQLVNLDADPLVVVKVADTNLPSAVRSIEQNLLHYTVVKQHAFSVTNSWGFPRNIVLYPRYTVKSDAASKKPGELTPSPIDLATLFSQDPVQQQGNEFVGFVRIGDSTITILEKHGLETDSLDLNTADGAALASLTCLQDECCRQVLKTVMAYRKRIDSQQTQIVAIQADLATLTTKQTTLQAVPQVPDYLLRHVLVQIARQEQNLKGNYVDLYSLQGQLDKFLERSPTPECASSANRQSTGAISRKAATSTGSIVVSSGGANP